MADGLTHPVQASTLRKGAFVLLQGQPCKIIEMLTSKPGKHGSAKIHFFGTNIFTGKKVDGIHGVGDKVLVPNITRTDYTLNDIDDNFLSLMDEKGTLKEDLPLPEGELGEEIMKAFQKKNSTEIIITVQVSMAIEKVIGFQETKVQN